MVDLPTEFELEEPEEMRKPEFKAEPEEVLDQFEFVGEIDLSKKRYGEWIDVETPEKETAYWDGFGEADHYMAVLGEEIAVYSEYQDTEYFALATENYDLSSSFRIPVSLDSA